ncbi:pectinesterase family protein [Catenovulum maritimum]|uniref:Pectinesterase catalytic domain-containing protein n=1 Tax=Catenovulum maritimum TaxID=1513271 RepID=A0A0J8GLS0_9ALTE|nr:pectinesterase family protein [Catenovulum maritimum]KMT63767.1 hypothetical protein XM47_18000 [Catenovulum maritimum]
MLILVGCQAPLLIKGENKYDAIVTLDETRTGDNIFYSVQAAIDAVPSHLKQAYVIKLEAGLYYQQVTINKDNLILLGAGQDKTIIRYDLYAGKINPETGKKYSTFSTATLTITGQNTYIENLTIENGFDFPANERLGKADPNYIRGTQAVALKIASSSNKSVLTKVKLKGYQDTLFVDGGQSYFYDTQIMGNVDFIFGQGNALFENSKIISLKRHKKTSTSGYITAPSTQISQEYGLTFIDCEFIREEGLADHSVYLGRPWHPTTTFSDGRYADPNAIGKAIYINSRMDSHIHQDGWTSMKGTSRDGTKKTIFYPKDSRFYEFNSTGSGAAINEKRRQLSLDELKIYSLDKIFPDWKPKLLNLSVK